MPFPWTKSQWGDALTSTPAPLVSFYISEQNLLAFSLWSLVDSECAHLLKVATSEYYRRRGCARGLIEEDLENLAMRDYRRFYLEVGSENYQPNAPRFKERRPHHSATQTGDLRAQPPRAFQGQNNKHGRCGARNGLWHERACEARLAVSRTRNCRRRNGGSRSPPLVQAKNAGY